MINTRKNSKNGLFPLTLPNPGCQWATGNWTSYWNYSGSYGKATRRSSTGLQSQQILLVQQFNATHGLPSVKDIKRRRQRRFSAFFSFNSSHQFNSWSKSTRAQILIALGALGAKCLRHESILRIKREKETLNVLLEKTRIHNVKVIVSNYIKVRPKASWADLICRTDQCFQRQRLP